MADERIEPDRHDGGVGHADEGPHRQRNHKPAARGGAGFTLGDSPRRRRRHRDSAASHPRGRHGRQERRGMRGPEGITGPAALAKFSWLTRPAMWAATSRNTPPTVVSGAAAMSG
jgi:hypothetical protein